MRVAEYFHFELKAKIDLILNYANSLRASAQMWSIDLV